MATRFINDFRVLIVPGLHDSGPAHWQSSWQRLYPQFERVRQVRWDIPHLAAWSETLARVLRQSEQRTLIVAHSFGCLATAHLSCLDARNVAGALLVAPADPERFGLTRTLGRDRLLFPSILIGSGNDPWMSHERALHWAQCWGSDFVNAGDAGHINAESDLGVWLFGLTQLQRLTFAARTGRGNSDREARL